MSHEGTPAGPAMRLHWSSPLFELLNIVKQMIALLVGALFAGSHDEYGVYVMQWLVVAAVAVTLWSLLRCWTTRLWLEPGEIVLKQGLLFRSVRHIPFERVQNLMLKQGLLHRLFGVGALRIESGGAASADADLRVLSLVRARELERTVRGRGPGGSAIQATHVDPVLLRLSLAEVLRAGMVMDRGFAIVAAGLFGLTQLDLPGFDIGQILKWLWQTAAGIFGFSAWSLLLLVLVGLLLVKLLTVLLSLSQALLLWYGFVLDRDGPRLRVESGLLSRTRSAATPERIQTLSLYDGLWLRLLRRRAIGLQVVGVGTELNAERPLQWLAPIVAEHAVPQLVREVYPGLRLERLLWQSLHASTHRRLALKSALVWLLLNGLALIVLPLVLPLTLLGALGGQLHSWAWTRYSAFALDDEFLAWRSGVSDRLTWVLPLRHIGAVQKRVSPFDRRHGTASLVFDTQASQHHHRLVMSFLPEALADDLVSRVRRTRMQVESQELLPS